MKLLDSRNRSKRYGLPLKQGPKRDGDPGGTWVVMWVPTGRRSRRLGLWLLRPWIILVPAGEP